MSTWVQRLSRSFALILFFKEENVLQFTIELGKNNDHMTQEKNVSEDKIFVDNISSVYRVGIWVSGYWTF